MSITRKSRYYKTRYKTFVLRFSFEKDGDLIRELEERKNITGYIRELLKKEFSKK